MLETPSLSLSGNPKTRNDTYSFECCSWTAYLATEPITYKTVTPLSPWQGDSTKRVVGLVTGQSHKISRAGAYEYHSLMYIVSSHNSMDNSIPLTPYLKPWRHNRPKTPQPSIYRRVLTEIPLEFNSNLVPKYTETAVRNHLVVINSAMEQLCKLRTLGYVTQLRESIHREKRCCLLESDVGDVVMKMVTRQEWPLEIIVKVQEFVIDGQFQTAPLCNGVTHSIVVYQLEPLEENPLNHPSKMRKTFETHTTTNPPTSAALYQDIRYPQSCFRQIPCPKILDTLKIGNSKITTEPSIIHETIRNIGKEDEEPLRLADQTSIDKVHHNATTVVPDHGRLRQLSGRAREYLYKDSKAKPIDYTLTAELSGTPPPGEC
ncbi:unnamed protein product [Caenorhabditis nigoni]